MRIDDFTLENWLNPACDSEKNKYYLGGSCVLPMTVEELFDLTGESMENFFEELKHMNLGYPRFEGTPRTRKALSKLYKNVEPDEVILCHGGTGANATVCYALIESTDNIISIMPNYQQFYSIPRSIGAELREAEDEVLRRTEEKKQVERLLETVSQAEDTCRRELERFLQRSGSDEGRLSLLSGQLEGVQAELAKITAQKQALQAQADEQAQLLSQLQDGIAALRMTIAEKHAEKTAAEQTISQMQALREAMQGDRAQKQALIDSFRVQIETTEQDIVAQYAQIETLQKDADAKEQTLKTEVEARTAMEAKRNQTEKQAQEKNKDILLLERESARLEQKKATSELEQKQLIDKLWESYELTPSSAKEQTVEVESIAAANRRIGEVKRKMSSLGTPNLGAIDEFTRVNTRYTFLTGQRDDILKAKRELTGIIADVTGEMEGIFTTQFQAIDQAFRQTFLELFGGGKAALVLEDPEHVLDSGIEIKVQPPGKALSTLSLMSGGEMAFVAIALYFAILKVRPTPFCVMDEIEAALDEANVTRYVQYMRRLAKNTQFLVITHRRGTMEEADHLFGVTMQEKGVSRVIELSLDEAAKTIS